MSTVCQQFLRICDSLYIEIKHLKLTKLIKMLVYLPHLLQGEEHTCRKFLGGSYDINFEFPTLHKALYWSLHASGAECSQRHWTIFHPVEQETFNWPPSPNMLTLYLNAWLFINPPRKVQQIWLWLSHRFVMLCCLLSCYPSHRLYLSNIFSCLWWN